MGVALDGACKLGWYKKMGFVVYRRLKTNDLSEVGGKFPLHVIYRKPFQVQSCLLCLQTKKKTPLDKQNVHAVSNCSVTAKRRPSLRTVRRLQHRLLI